MIYGKLFKVVRARSTAQSLIITRVIANGYSSPVGGSGGKNVINVLTRRGNRYNGYDEFAYKYEYNSVIR